MLESLTGNHWALAGAFLSVVAFGIWLVLRRH